MVQTEKVPKFIFFARRALSGKNGVISGVGGDGSMPGKGRLLRSARNDMLRNPLPPRGGGKEDRAATGGRPYPVSRGAYGGGEAQGMSRRRPESTMEDGELAPSRWMRGGIRGLAGWGESCGDKKA